MLVNIKIDSDVLLDMLMERVEYWGKEDFFLDLWEKHYSESIWAGRFEGVELDIWQIVDNDVNNWTRIIEREELGEKNFNFLIEYVEENGSDVSSEMAHPKGKWKTISDDIDGFFSFVYAYNDTAILVSHN